MVRVAWRHCTGLSLLVVATASPALPDSCGVASLFDLAGLLGLDIDAAKREAAARHYNAPEVSMFDIQQAAADIGLRLVPMEATLGELETQFRGPKIAHLGDPPHFTVIAAMSAAYVQFIDDGMIGVLPRTEFERRYSGHALVLADTPPGDGGRLAIEEFHHVFGVSGVGQTVEHTFTLRNAGNRALTVESDSCNSCGAPEVSVGEELLPPGKSTAVTVRFTNPFPGNVMRSAKLRTNDPRAAVVYLTLQGKVPHDVQVRPARLYVSRPKNAVSPLTVTVSGPADMNLKEASCERGQFEVRIQAPALDANDMRTWQVQLALRARDFVGRIDDQLAIRTTHPDRPLITVPITGEVRGDLDLRPGQVFFGFVKVGDKAEQTVTIASRSRATFAVKSATLEGVGLRVTGPVRPGNGTWKVTVALGAERPGVIDAKLVLTTDVPGEGTLEVPVYAHVVAPRS